MASKASQNRLRRRKEIRRHNLPASFPCDLCLSEGEACYIMPGDNFSACAHCAGRGRKCVTTSWASLDHARDELEVKITQDEKAREALLEQLNALQMRLIRNRQVKKKKEEEAANKLRCMEAEMAIEGEELLRSVAPDPLSVEECLASHDVTSPFQWFDDSGQLPNMPLFGVGAEYLAPRFEPSSFGTREPESRS
jgi:hypothetical protein